MPRVICTLPNASTTINNVRFEPHPDGGMVSVDLPAAVAAEFCRIPGYRLAPPEPPAPAPAAPPEPPKQEAGEGQASGSGKRGGRAKAEVPATTSPVESAGAGDAPKE